MWNLLNNLTPFLVMVKIYIIYIYVDIARLAEIGRILGECLLISSLPGKASRTFVELAGLVEIT